MYTVVNSRAYADEASTGLENWQIAAIIIDILFAGLIVLLEVRTIKRYKKDVVKIDLGAEVSN